MLILLCPQLFMSTKFSVLKELFMDLYNPVGSYDYFKNLLLSLIKEVNKCFLIIHESYLSWVSDSPKALSSCNSGCDFI